jgi:hypothetical protein
MDNATNKLLVFPFSQLESFSARITGHTASGNGFQYNVNEVGKGSVGLTSGSSDAWTTLDQTNDGALVVVAYNLAENGAAGQCTPVPTGTIVTVIPVRYQDSMEYWFSGPAGVIQYATLQSGDAPTDGADHTLSMVKDGSTDTVSVLVYCPGGQQRFAPQSVASLHVGSLPDSNGANRAVVILSPYQYFYGDAFGS